MLENTVWRQYHNENNFRDKIAEFCRLETIDLIEDDKLLYSVLKSKLTKKELKLFAMDCANVDDSVLKEEFGYDDEALEKAKFKLYKKLKQDKTRLDFRETNTTEIE
ncbi:hypothetical protein [Sulfurimonas paralvinellae]|uniref:Uncharacterized protein n=1 Tax=Sulfurimonas paralvinellae TaxID=317658 RepID=A0A7M1BBS5_9BACT|nr:hypothetical protein [Sulfurimonas paralvinellae]QOP46268.1 hypothetical protein FM071_08175 [Sulfurimonas paralvinellae]